MPNFVNKIDFSTNVPLLCIKIMDLLFLIKNFAKFSSSSIYKQFNCKYDKSIKFEYFKIFLKES